MYLFYFKALILELQNIFLIVRYFNLISCSKSLKAKILCFFCFFFLFCPLRLEFSRIRKTTSFLTSNKLKIDKSASTDLHGLRENVVNVENSQFLRRNGSFFSVSWVKWNQSVYSITLPCSRIFTACFYHFLFWRYLNSSMTSFSSDILLPFPNSNDLNSRGCDHRVKCMYQSKAKYQRVFKTFLNIYDEFFLQKQSKCKSCKSFRKKRHHRYTFDMNMALRNISNFT